VLHPPTYDELFGLEKPEEWEVQTIDRLAEWVAMGPFGSSIKVSTFVADGIPYGVLYSKTLSLISSPKLMHHCFSAQMFNKEMSSLLMRGV
jgi:hypothetical protein